MRIIGRLVCLCLLALPMLGLAVKDDGFANFKADQVQQEVDRQVEQVLVSALKEHIAFSAGRFDFLDPIRVPDLNFTITQPTFHVTISLWNTTLNGLSALELNRAHVNFTNLVSTFGVALPSLVVKGQYKMHGRFGLVVPITGEGGYSIALNNATAEVSTDLAYVSAQQIFQLTALDYKVTLGDLVINFENIMGGMADAINAMLSSTALVAVRKIETAIHEPLVSKLLVALNKELASLTLPEIDGFVTAVIDKVIDVTFARIDAEMTAQGYNHIDLPEIIIKAPLSLARLGLKDGYIEGLATIHRTAPSTFNIVDGKLKLGLSFGTNTTFFTYSAVAKFMTIGPDARVDGYLDPINIAIVLSYNPENNNLRVDQFDTIIPPIRFEVTGLWFLDNVIDDILTIVANTVSIFIEGLINTFFKFIINRII